VLRKVEEFKLNGKAVYLVLHVKILKCERHGYGVSVRRGHWRCSLPLLRRLLIKVTILMTAIRIERSIRTMSRESNSILVIFATPTFTSSTLYLCQDLLFIVYICFGAPAFDGLVGWI